MNTQSPCVKQCKLNESRECVSCGRDIESIANWSRMSDEEKHLANQHASARLARAREVNAYEVA
jgi:uncharacterized protein